MVLKLRLVTFLLLLIGTYILLMAMCLDIEIVTIAPEPSELAPSPAEVSALLREAEGICLDETGGEELGEGGRKTPPKE